MEQTYPLITVEEQFKIMADTAPVLIWMAGVDKLCYFFNSGWLKFTGRTMEQEYGNGWAEGVHPEDMERCLDIYVTSFDARKEFKMEYRLKRYDGQYRWLLENGVPRYTNDGEFAGYIGSCIDIDELLETQKSKEEYISKEALKKEQSLNESLAAANEELAASNEEITAINEELYESQLSLYKLNQELEGRVASRTKALTESEANFRSVILQSPVAMGLFKGTNMVLEIINVPLLELWEKDKTIVGKALLDALPELKGQPYLSIMQEVMATGESYFGNESLVYLERNGRKEEGFFNFINHPFRDEQGNISGIIVVANEVTDQVKARKLLEESFREQQSLNEGLAVINEQQAITNEELMEAQEQLKQLVEQLAMSESRFRSLVQNAPVAICVLKGRELLIESANDMSLKILGKPKAIIGKPVAKVLPELKSQQFLQLLDQVYTTGQPYYGYEAHTLLEHNAQLQEFYIDFIYQPLFDASGITNAIMVVSVDVTEHTKAKKAVVRAEEMLRYSIDAANIGTYFIDESSRALVASPRLKELFGYNPDEEMPYDAAINQITDEYRQKVTEAVEASFLNGESFFFEYTILGLNDNRLRWVRAVGKRGQDSNGSTYFSGVIMDITDQVEASKSVQHLNDELVAINKKLTASHQSLEISQGELRENEQKFRLLADNISQLAWMTDETGWIFWYNQRWYDYTGTTLEEMQGWGWSKVHHPDMLERVTEKFKQHLQSGEVWEDTFLIKSKHGEYRWFLSRAIPVRNDENRIIRWLGTNTDITDKILSEQQLAAKNKELSFLADSIPSIVWTSKPNGELDYINSRWHEREPDTEDLPLGNSWLDNLHPDDVERTRKTWRESVSTGEPYGVEFRLKDKKGNYRWFLVRALAMRDEKGNIIKWYGNNTDIHEQKELQQQKDDFISIASHELKTPITSLKASIQLMERIKNKPEAKLLPKLIEQSEKSVQKISNLVEELLNVGRLNEGQLQLNKSTFNLAELLKDCCNAIRLENKHELSIEGDTELRIVADEHRIDQVVTNLINNAIKYAPYSKKICLSISKENNQAKVSVEDNGPGIRPEKLPHLFDRYFRAEPNTAKNAGLGLGLYISAEIIRRHDGQIGVDSILGKGSTFWFTLPINTSAN